MSRWASRRQPFPQGSRGAVVLALCITPQTEGPKRTGQRMRKGVGAAVPRRGCGSRTRSHRKGCSYTRVPTACQGHEGCVDTGPRSGTVEPSAWSSGRCDVQPLYTPSPAPGPASGLRSLLPARGPCSGGQQGSGHSNPTNVCTQTGKTQRAGVPLLTCDWTRSERDSPRVLGGLGAGHPALGTGQGK